MSVPLAVQLAAEPTHWTGTRMPPPEVKCTQQIDDPPQSPASSHGIASWLPLQLPELLVHVPEPSFLS